MATMGGDQNTNAGMSILSRSPGKSQAQPNNSISALISLLLEFPSENMEWPHWKILIFEGHFYFFFN